VLQTYPTLPTIIVWMGGQDWTTQDIIPDSWDVSVELAAIS